MQANKYLVDHSFIQKEEGNTVSIAVSSSYQAVKLNRPVYRIPFLDQNGDRELPEQCRNGQYIFTCGEIVDGREVIKCDWGDD